MLLQGRKVERSFQSPDFSAWELCAVALVTIYHRFYLLFCPPL
ncbi:unnamed protein product [Gulo gulo]|uniref:Uncharacterized protein n=1 Tax=Gulo gulo TaxID=48420 RepID=A0A9X9M1W5_GULGU|nr:unnamed protein product [Gulo gulo]